MSEQLRSTVGQVRQGAETIALASSEIARGNLDPVSYTHLRAHETVLDLVCRLLLEKTNTETALSHH